MRSEGSKNITVIGYLQNVVRVKSGITERKRSRLLKREHLFKKAVFLLPGNAACSGDRGHLLEFARHNISSLVVLSLSQIASFVWWMSETAPFALSVIFFISVR